MKHRISADDRDFLRRFSCCEIEVGGFHHREHVRLAYIFLVLYGVEEACPKFRASLQAFLRHNRVDPAKYHETMTQAWILAVFHFMQTAAARSSSTEFMDANPMLMNPRIMLTHYSSELIGSDRARAHFVEPDMDPIPRHAGSVNAPRHP